MGEENLQILPDSLKNHTIFLILSYKRPHVLAFFYTLETTSQYLAKGAFEWQRLNQGSGEKETYKSAEEWI